MNTNKDLCKLATLIPPFVKLLLSLCTFSVLVSQDGSHQAQINLKFLSVLKDPCHELAEAYPKDIPPMLPRILSLIRMIWVNSEFYNTRERLTGILRKVICRAVELTH